MPGNPKFDPFHWVKIVPKLEKPTDHSHKLNSSEDGQDTSAYKISGQSLYAFSGKCPETSPDGRTDRRTDGRTCRKTVTVGRVDQRTHVQVKRGYFRLRTDGRTDGQPENIMPPAPKGGGIKRAPLSLNKTFWRSKQLFWVVRCWMNILGEIYIEFSANLQPLKWVSFGCFHLFSVIRVQRAGGTQEITKALWIGIRLQEMSGGYYTGIRKLGPDSI